MPDFDDKDLAIICIAAIGLLVGLITSWRGNLEVGIPLLTAAITAIAALGTGRKRE